MMAQSARNASGAAATAFVSGTTGVFSARRLSFFDNFQLRFHARRELPEHLPRNFFDHSASELDDLSDQIDVGVNHDLRTTTRQAA